MDSIIHMATAPKPDDNSSAPATERGTLMRQARTFGEQEATGANSRPALARLVVEGARQRTITLEPAKSKTASDDVAAIWENFTKGLAAKKGVGWVKQPSAAQQTSKLRAFVKLGLLPQVNGVKVFTNAAEVIAKMREANKDKLPKSPFDMLVSAARYQTTHSADAELTKEQLEAVMSGEDKDDATEADKLDAIAKAMAKVINDSETVCTAETATIIEAQRGQILARIKELGGTTAEVKAMAANAARVAKLQAQVVALSSK